MTSNFVRIVKEESKTNVLAYEANLFRATDLKYLSAEDARLVTQHVVARLQTEARDRELTSDTFLTLIDGIGPYLEESDIWAFVSSAMHILPMTSEQSDHTDSPDVFGRVYDRVRMECLRMSETARAKAIAEFRYWSKMLTSEHFDDFASIADGLYRVLKAEPDDAEDVTPDDIPF